MRRLRIRGGVLLLSLVLFPLQGIEAAAAEKIPPVPWERDKKPDPPPPAPESQDLVEVPGTEDGDPTPPKFEEDGGEGFGLLSACPSAELIAPPDLEVVETESPTLEIERPICSPGEWALMNYQVATDDGFHSTTMVVESQWLEREYSWPVPSGKLEDGENYFWRVQSIIEQCPGCGGDMITSDTFRFTVSIPKWGSDPRWAMWSQSLGNGMTLNVNQANGNLFLDYPLDSLVTPAGALDLRLGYNSQQDRDFDFSDGWTISGGPAAEPGPLPVRLVEVTYSSPADGGVRIRFSDGSRQHFPHLGDHRYGSIGGGAGVVTRSDDTPRWTLRTATGSHYTFNAAGELTKALQATGGFGEAGFNYTYQQGRLQTITDPLGRDVSIQWNGSVPVSLSTWAHQSSWTLGYGVGGLTSVSDPGGSTVEFSYNGQGKMATVTDGEDNATSVGYSSSRVSEITLAGQSAPTTFDYQIPFTGTFAARTDLTDPRGVPTQDPDDFETHTSFNSFGYPIQIDGPRDNDGHWPTTTQLWDTNYNLVCRRNPPANTDFLGCTDPEEPETDVFQSDYTYQVQPPHLVKSETGPAPGVNQETERPVTTYNYDEGFEELYAEFFANRHLAGVPEGAGFQEGLLEDWGQGSPDPLGSRTDDWTVRFSGRLEVPADDRYTFRATSPHGAGQNEDDGVRVAVGRKLVLDCWDSISSCPEADFRLGEGERRFVVEYRDGSGPASLRVCWARGQGNCETVAAEETVPDVNLLTSVTDPAGATQYFYEDDDKALRRVTREIRDDRETSYLYDNVGRVIEITDPLGFETNHEYEGACLTSVTDRTDAFTEYECNAAGDTTLTIQHIRAVGPQSAHTRQTRTTYDALGRVDTVEVFSGGSFQIITDNDYDDAGRLVEVADAAGAVTTYEYDPAGRMVEETLPDPDDGGPLDPPVIAHEYDAVGNEIETTDARGKVWTKTYDAHNRVEVTRDPFCQQFSDNDPECTWTFTVYDFGALRTLVFDRASVQYTTTYDHLGRKVAEQVNGQDVSRWIYDPAGRLVREEDTAGVWVEREFNPFGQVTEELHPTSAGGEAATTYDYDFGGRLEAMTDARSFETTFEYDNEGRLTSVTLPIDTGATTSYLYDDAGERVRTTDGDAREFEATYDERGRQVTAADSRGTTEYEYDSLSRLVRVEMPNTVTQRFVYDALGRRIRRYGEVSGGGTVDDETFAYDPAGNMTLAARTDGSHDVVMEYDDAGRLHSVDAEDHTTDFGYELGRLAFREDPAGRTEFAYDNNGQLQTLTDIFGVDMEYEYDSAARLIGRDLPSQGLATSWTYDPAGRVDTLETTAGMTPAASFDLAYDEIGNVVELEQEVDGYPVSENGTWDYGYDEASRLTSATDPAEVTTEYEYDGAGNRTSVKVGNDPAVTTSYDGAGHPDSASDGTEYQTDATGRLTEVTKLNPVEVTQYSYDTWNRLAEATVTPQVIEYSYDALDRTLSRTEGLVTTQFAFAGITEDLAWQRDFGLGGAPVPGSRRTYAHSPEGPLAVASEEAARYIITNVHGDVVGLYGSGVEGTLSYSPWGERRTASGVSGDTPFGFQGSPTDSDTQLVDMMTRLYRPDLGRFLTRDVVSGNPTRPTSLNPFAYASDNPATFDDPTGLCSRPADCPQITGPSGQNHSHEFVSRIDNGGADPNPFTHSTAPPSEGMTLRQFRRLTTGLRIRWVDWFQARYGTAEWFNGQRGVLRAFLHLGIGDPPSWSSVVDAAILHSIQNGMRAYLGQSPRGSNPAGPLWGAFFTAVFYNVGVPDRLLYRLWSAAESTATRWGMRVAAGIEPTQGEVGVLRGSEVYRGVLNEGGGLLRKTLVSGYCWVAHCPGFLEGFLARDFDPRDQRTTFEGTLFAYNLYTPYGDHPCSGCL